MGIPAPQTAPVTCGVRAKRRYAPCLRCTTDFRLPHSTQHTVRTDEGGRRGRLQQAGGVALRAIPLYLRLRCSEQKGRHTRPCQLSNKEPDFRADNHRETLRCMK